MRLERSVLIQQRPKPNQARGLTFVEFLVAITLTSFLILGLLQVFIGSKKTFQLHEGVARLQENARFAIDIIGREARMAGFLGCYSIFESSNILFLLNSVNYHYEIDNPIETYTGNKNGSFSSQAGRTFDSLPASIRNKLTTESSNSDILTIRRVINGRSLVNEQTTPIHPVTISGAIQDYASGDMAIISDCGKATVFQITGTSITGANQLEIAHAQGSGSPGNRSALLSDDGTIFGLDSQIYRVISRVFYVAPSETPGVPEGTNSLWQQDQSGTDEELITGVTSFNYLIGTDHDGDYIPDQYLEPHLANTSNIITIRLTLSLENLTNNPEEQLERTFIETVKVRNRKVLEDES